MFKQFRIIPMITKGLKDPTLASNFVSLGYVDYIFGSLFIALGLSMLLFVRKAREKRDDYKKRQLEQYKKDTNKKNVRYEDTGLYLPAWERMKAFAPMFFALLFVVIGITMCVGQPISLV